MSEPHLSTRSKICMLLKKLKVFFRLRRPETHFMQAHGLQRASALTGFIKIFQSTTITVYEVKHQKTVNTKLGKQIIWFSEVVKEFHHHFQEKKAGRHKKIKVWLQNIPKAYQSILQILWLKSTTFFKEQTRIPLKLNIKKMEVVKKE